MATLSGNFEEYEVKHTSCTGVLNERGQKKSRATVSVLKLFHIEFIYLLGGFSIMVQSNSEVFWDVPGGGFWSKPLEQLGVSH